MAIEKRRQAGLINLNTLTRLGRKVLADKTLKASEMYSDSGKVWMVYLAVPAFYDVLASNIHVEHADRATARRMMKAALDVANAPRKRKTS